MNRYSRNSKLLMGLGAAMMAALLLSGCAQTVAPEPNIIQRASGETPAPPPPSGFLGNDYSLLTPPAAGSDQNAALRYINPNANWASYNKIMIAPVTYWAGDDTKVSAADQQALCNYMYTVLVTDLGKTFTIVDQPGPGVIKVSAALEDASFRGSRSAINFRRSAAGSRAECYQDGRDRDLRVRRFRPGRHQVQRLRDGTVTGCGGRQACRRRIDQERRCVAMGRRRERDGLLGK